MVGILKALEANAELTKQQLAVQAKASTSQIERAVSGLEAEGRISVEGDVIRGRIESVLPLIQGHMTETVSADPVARDEIIYDETQGRVAGMETVHTSGRRDAIVFPETVEAKASIGGSPPRDSVVLPPLVSLDATTSGSSTSTRNGKRVVSFAHVVLFLRNGDAAGEAKNCKVQLTTVAAPDFRLGPGATDASRHLLDGDTWRVLWQPGSLAPGAERELPLTSAEFAYDDDVSAKVRVTAEGIDPIEAVLRLSVARHDEGSIELDVSVS